MTLPIKDKLNDEDTATPLVRNVSDLVEVVNADKENDSDVPSTSADPKLLAKKQRKKRPKVAWKKSNRVHSKW